MGPIRLPCSTFGYILSLKRLDFSVSSHAHFDLFLLHKFSPAQLSQPYLLPPALSTVHGASVPYAPGDSISLGTHTAFAMPAASKDQSSIRQALERARNCDDGTVDAQTTTVLEAAIAELWLRIQAEPDSYVLSSDEFALFNYFLKRYRGSSVAQRAVARFWNNYHGSANTDGDTKT